MSHLPRKGQYELWNHRGWIYCIDDPRQPALEVNEEMFTWLHNLPKSECRPFDGDAAFYLTPQAYLMWKLKWAHG